MPGVICLRRLVLHAGLLSVVLAGHVRGEEAKNGETQSSHPLVSGFERFFVDAKGDPVTGGLLLLGELNCASCHHAAANVAAHVAQKQAPILDQVGGRVRPEFLRAFLRAPRAAKPGTTMPDLFAGWPAAEKDEAIDSLVHFLASTGAVRDARLNRKVVPDGRLLYRRVGCVACHGPREGNEPPLASSVPLPDLAAKYSIPSLTAFLLDPHKVRPSGRMPGLNLNLNEAMSLANYLLKDLDLSFAPNLAYRYYEGSWQELPKLDDLKPLAEGTAEGFDVTIAKRENEMALRFEGELRLEAAGEYTFYLTSDDGSRLWIDDHLVVDNDGIHPPGTKEGRVTLIKGPHRLVAAVFNGGGGVELDVEMSRFGRGRQSVVTSLSPIKDRRAEAAKDQNRKAEPERFRIDAALAEKGRDVFARVGCAACHDLRINNTRIETNAQAPALSTLRSGGCLSGKAERGRPDYALSDSQAAALTAALQSAAKRAEHAPSPQQTIERSLLAFNCYACHQRGNQGGVERARDGDFETTQKEMGDEGRLPPPLTGVGGKLTPEYLKNVIAEGAKDRPYMLTRMPKFGAGGTAALAEALSNTDHVEPVSVAEFSDSPRRVKSQGRFLAGSQALGCIKCHTFKGVQAEGVQAIDMTIMTRRLRHDWFHRYLRNPQAFRPGTRMPAAWPDGMSLLPKVFGGDTSQQIESIWRFLSDGTNAAEPYGLGREPMPLVPETEAILYRNFIQGAGPRAIGVGYPEKANIAYDANDMRIALIWQGAFIDASRHWNGRGEGFQPPLGDNVVPLPEGPPLAALPSPTHPWPSEHAKALGYRFRGYRLTKDQRPTFLFDFDKVHVADFPNALAGTDFGTIERTLTFKADTPAENLWFRAAVADKIEPKGDGWYLVNGEWKVRITSKSAPVVRTSNGKSELLVPVSFQDHQAVIHERFEW
ncbi:MAG: PA14 domain-containing protein [Isosphaeraceae bacterium]|nr:PA14 domain-containing protein [Isosphaeraceae bacterium]